MIIRLNQLFLHYFETIPLFLVSSSFLFLKVIAASPIRSFVLSKSPKATLTAQGLRIKEMTESSFADTLKIKYKVYEGVA